MSDSWFKSQFVSIATKKKISEKSLNKIESNKSIPQTKQKIDPNEDEKSTKSINWLKEFQPKEVSELVVHPKKIEDLKNWLTIECSRNPNKILIIEGPTGSAKTSTFKLLAKECGFEISEWINNRDKEFSISDDNFVSSYVSYQDRLEEFENFLSKSSKFNSLITKRSKNQRILLVKDFPDFLLKKPDEFCNVLKIHQEDGNFPLVFILTETSSKSLNISYNLFPDKVRREFKIDTITFNPISITLMKRGLKRIFQMIEANPEWSEMSTKPADEVLENIIENSAGDIRNAILNINIATRGSDIKMIAKVLKKSKKGQSKSKTSKKVDNQSSLGKNEVLTLMHGVGRVMYPKLELNEKTKILQLTHKPEEIAENFSSQPNNFIEMIHSNYIKNFSNIENVSCSADNLSIADCIAKEYRDSQLPLLNLDLVIRSTMVNNHQPALGFRTVSCYASKKFQNVKDNYQQKLRDSMSEINNGHILAPKDFFCDYNSFLNILK